MTESPDPRVESVSLHDSDVVRSEYAEPERLALRTAAFQKWLRGPDARDSVFVLVAAIEPRTILDVGCGRGEFARRLASELEAEVIGLDASPEMVKAACAAGVDAELGDVRAMPYRSGTFDCVVANWVLYHVNPVDDALREIIRVLKPDGCLVAATTSDYTLREIWDMVSAPPLRERSFTLENGEEALARFFRAVERHTVRADVVFPDWDAVKGYVNATIARRDYARRVVPFKGEFRATALNGVFVASDPIRAADLGGDRS